MTGVNQDELYALAHQVVDQAADLANVVNELTQELKIVAVRIQKNPQNDQLDQLIARIEVFKTTVKETMTFVEGLDLKTPPWRLRFQSLWQGREALEEFYQAQFSKLQAQSREARTRLIALQKINFDLANLV
jgi:predicted ribosome quality control (RQC) complex YloA/Tae2 family protein